jgi:C-terminal peptidase prc
MRYYNITNVEYPIFISRVYPKSPAGKAHVPRYGNILNVNGIELKGGNAKATYDSVMTYNKNINILVTYKGDTTLFKLQKEEVYAPTVFVDTSFNDSAKGYPGIIFITIEGFKPTTADQDSGSYGELKAYLDSTKADKRVRVLDLRGNPGGHVNQCLAMADLFVSEGTLSTRHMRLLGPDGDTQKYTLTVKAKSGDAGENGKYIIIGNQGSASCAEIFIAAVTETTDIPFIGRTTYGKGVGQTNYDTYAGGIATITDLEFLTPKGNSYHGKGIVPKYICENIISDNCAAQYANKLYGVKIPKQDEALAKHASELTENTVEGFEGGAIEWADSEFYLNAFKHLEH